MSTEPLNAPEVLEFGDDNEKGFLDGVQVTVKSIRYGKLEYNFNAPKPGEEAKEAKEAIKPKIAAKAIYVTAKNQKELRAQEYSLGVDWDNDGAVSVTPDGKSLRIRAGFKLPKRSDFNHLRESFIRAGISEDLANKNDLSVYDGESFVMVSEKNPRAGDQAKPKPFPHQRVVGGVAQAAPSSSSAPTPAAGPAIDPAVVAAAQAALTQIVSDAGKPVGIMSLWSNALLNNYFDSVKADAGVRTSVSQTLFANKDNLNATVLAGTALEAAGGEIKFKG